MTPSLILISQLLIALGIYNVWLLRPQKQTAWRGGDAKNMEEEFHVYGLSTTCMKIVRVCKLSCATALLIGFFFKPFAVAWRSLCSLPWLCMPRCEIRLKNHYLQHPYSSSR